MFRLTITETVISPAGGAHARGGTGTEKGFRWARSERCICPHIKRKNDHKKCQAPGVDWQNGFQSEAVMVTQAPGTRGAERTFDAFLIILSPQHVNMQKVMEQFDIG